MQESYAFSEVSFFDIYEGYSIEEYYSSQVWNIYQLYFASWQHNIQVQIQMQNVGLQYKVKTTSKIEAYTIKLKH